MTSCNASSKAPPTGIVQMHSFVGSSSKKSKKVRRKQLKFERVEGFTDYVKKNWHQNWQIYNH